MATLANHFGDSLEKMAAATDSNPKHLSQIKNRVRNIGNKTSERMEASLGLTQGAWDRPIEDGEAYAEGSKGLQKLSSLYLSLDPSRQARALAMLEAAFGDSLEDQKSE